MPTERSNTQRNDRAYQQRPNLKLPPQGAQQTAHPLIVGGPEAVRDSHC